MTEEEIKKISPVALAFLGDAVYTLYVREKLVKRGDGKIGDYQKNAAKIVSAHGQSEFLKILEPHFTSEENEIFHRGRNAKKSTKSKNAKVGEYNRSTGFEAVIGYLYLKGEKERLYQLLGLLNEEAYKPEEKIQGFKP